jgi:hypothetical protein
MPPALIERRTERVFDSKGRNWQQVVYSRRMTPEEYDAVCERLPASAISLQRAAGDLRTGAQLLADMPADRSVTIAGLAGCERGRALLSRLAAEILQLFAPLIDRSAAVLAADTDSELHDLALNWLASLGRQYPSSGKKVLDPTLRHGLDTASQDQA